MSMDIRAMFAAKKAEPPMQGQRDAITLFKGSVRTQIKKLDELAKNPKANIAQTNWFKAYDGGYRLQLGKKPIELDGAKYWQASSIEEAKALYEGALSLADTDADFQAAIRAAKKPSPGEPDKPRRGRKPKSA